MPKNKDTNVSKWEPEYERIIGIIRHFFLTKEVTGNECRKIDDALSNRIPAFITKVAKREYERGKNTVVWNQSLEDNPEVETVDLNELKKELYQAGLEKALSEIDQVNFPHGNCETLAKEPIIWALRKELGEKE